MFNLQNIYEYAFLRDELKKFYAIDFQIFINPSCEQRYSRTRYPHIGNMLRELQNEMICRATSHGKNVS